MAGALKNLRVLDATHVLAGPFCGYQLALLGADVIKIEPPTAPDCARGRGPDDERNARGLGLTYQVQGANKRALALDMTTAEGRDILLALVRDADVFIENYTTGALGRLGLGYEDLAAQNTGLIYCSMTGFGDTGPKAATGAYDNVIQATSGIIAQSAGHKPGVSFVDYAAGYSAAFAIMAALHQRQHSGRGTHISASMLEVAMSLMAPEVAAAQQRDPIRRPSEAGIITYETLDGQLMPGAFHPAQYGRLDACLSELGHTVEGLSSIRDWPDVWAHADTLRPQLASVFLTRTADEWVELLHAADLPAERIRKLSEAVEEPQLDARGYFAASPDDPDVLLPLAAFSLSQGGPEITRSPPTVGQHSSEILEELGYSADTIVRLRKDGVIA